MEKVFKTTFNRRDERFFNVKLNKLSSVLDTVNFDANNSKPEDIYYDDVIIYDGGGVDGYGY